MKRNLLAAALFLPLSAQGDTTVLQNNKLFLEIWNGAVDDSGQSYIKDLGITLDNFLTAPGCYAGVVANLASDAKLAGLKSGGNLPETAIWTVQAVNDDGLDSFQNAAGNNPQDARNHSGFLATVADPEEIKDPVNYMAYIDPVTAMKNHLNSAEVTGSKAFGASDLGYYLEEGWDGFMNQTVGFTSSTQVGGTMAMYFFTVDADFVTGAVGRDGQALGSWSFDGNQVSFTSATQPAGPCPTTTPTPDPNPTPTPTPTPIPTPTPESTPDTAPVSGGNLRFLFPKSGDNLKTGIRQPIGWLSGEIGPKQRLNLYYSKNGGATWKLVKRRLRGNGYFLWKPGKRQISHNGKLAICLPASKTALAECAATEGVFSIHE